MCVSGVTIFCPSGVPTLSLVIGRISAEPAFVIGMTLIKVASRTAFAFVVVKRASIFTFHFVESQVRDWAVTIDPAQTKVHSEPAMYVL